jgi:hypothetical protein
VLVFPDAWDGAAIDALAETGLTWKQLLFPRLRPNAEQIRVLKRLSPCAAVMLVAGTPQAVIHSARPEWGLGRLRSKTGGSLEVEFNSGVRTFAPDARVLSGVEILGVGSA